MPPENIKKTFSRDIDKEHRAVMGLSQPKMRKNRNFYKSANINFLITFIIKNHHLGKLNKIYLVNIRFE